MKTDVSDASSSGGAVLDSQDIKDVRVTLVQRKKGAFWSLEGLFETVVENLPLGLVTKTVSAPHEGGSGSVIWRNLIWARSLRSEVFHVTGDIHYAILGLRGAHRILTIHDLRFLEEKRGLKRFLLWLLWVYLPVKAAARVTVISETTGSKLARLGRVNPRKVRVIPNCVSPVFQPVPKQWNAECPVLLQVGTTENKNVDRVVEACRALIVTLWILGRLSDEQERILDNSGLDYRCFSDLGWREVVSLYHQCDLVVFASLYEGFGMPILEAQAVGRPVLTSDRSPMREVAGGGSLLVDPFDVGAIREGLKRLIDDAELRADVVQNGFANVNKYSGQEVARQYAELYREVAATKARGEKR